MKRSRHPSNERHLLYGVNPVTEALRAERLPNEIIIAEGARDERLREVIELARRRGVPVNRVRRADLEREAGNANHQGVAARIPAPKYASADDLLESISARIGTGAEPLLLVLDGIEDPRNLGAILRTAECAGASGVFIPERRAAGLNETVAKASAGAVEYLPVARVTNLTVLIQQLKERNVWVVGTDAEGTTDYNDWDWTRPSAIVLGAEGTGLHRLVRENCDMLVRIPVHGRIESLNVSVAAGIVLYEALRQRAAPREQVGSIHR
ncbi:MAG TPA: 23S rRNA (guanosine(2251)-2'-O)-methyltransferase RlmB [Pyrinomonadaceae bacterium]|nr:23S rRNA (guanosine(2251)-2'-O)-methyltransferase RlmB [Pyrinomonadaceae bacterium]